MRVLRRSAGLRMTSPSDLLAALERQRDRQHFMSLPFEVRLRNTCPGCGCRFIDDDFSKATAFVTGPPKFGRCGKCGWTGTK